MRSHRHEWGVLFFYDSQWTLNLQLILLFTQTVQLVNTFIAQDNGVLDMENNKAIPCTKLHRVSKNEANLYLSELCQISTNFDDFWQKDGKEAKIMRGALIFHLT